MPRWRQPSASGTPPGAGAERRRRRDRSLVRHGLALLGVAVLLVAVWPLRLTTNEEHAAAIELSARFDALYQEVREGGLVLEEEPSQVAPGITGAAVAAGGREIRALVGTAEGRCYALWWDQAEIRHARVLAGDLPCEPAGHVASPLPQDFERAARVETDPDAPFDWRGVLPDRERLRYWFLPTLIIGGGVGLSALVRISIMLLTDRPLAEVRR